MPATRHNPQGPLLGNMTGAQQYRAIQAMTAHRAAMIVPTREYSGPAVVIPMQMNLRDPAHRVRRRTGYATIVGRMCLVAVSLLGMAAWALTLWVGV